MIVKCIKNICELSLWNEGKNLNYSKQQQWIELSPPASNWQMKGFLCENLMMLSIFSAQIENCVMSDVIVVRGKKENSREMNLKASIIQRYKKLYWILIKFENQFDLNGTLLFTDATFDENCNFFHKKVMKLNGWRPWKSFFFSLPV